MSRVYLPSERIPRSFKAYAARRCWAAHGLCGGDIILCQDQFARPQLFSQAEHAGVGGRIENHRAFIDRAAQGLCQQ